MIYCISYIMEGISTGARWKKIICQNGLVNKKLVFRDWTFLRFNFWCSSCYLAHWGDYNGIYDLWYHQTFSRFFWIFMSKVKYQKVVRLSTWVVESNSSFDKMKVWLNRSGRMKFQDNPITDWVGTVWLKMVATMVGQ